MATKKYIKDTWQFFCSFFLDAEQTQPKDMSAYTMLAEFYANNTDDPIALSVGSGITQLASNRYVYEVDPDQYANAAAIDPAKLATTVKFPCRLRVYDVKDGIITTRGVLAIAPAVI